MIEDFMDFLDHDREMQLQTAGKRNIRHTREQYRSIEIDERLRKVLENKRITRFYTRPAEAGEWT